MIPFIGDFIEMVYNLVVLIGDAIKSLPSPWGYAISQIGLTTLFIILIYGMVKGDI